MMMRRLVSSFDAVRVGLVDGASLLLVVDDDEGDDRLIRSLAFGDDVVYHLMVIVLYDPW